MPEGHLVCQGFESFNQFFNTFSVLNNRFRCEPVLVKILMQTVGDTEIHKDRVIVKFINYKQLMNH